MAPRARRYVTVALAGGRRVRTFPLHGAMLLAGVVLAAGFAGYFIPFSPFSIEKAAHNQQRNLERLNIDLLRRVHDMQPMVHGLQTQIAQLVVQRKTLDRGRGDSVRAERPRQASALGIDELLSQLVLSERSWDRVASLVDRQPAWFRALPVLLPVEGVPVLAVPFGRVRDPFSGTTKWHQGVDLVAARGTAILATADGTVSEVTNDRKWGLRVLLSHAHGFTTVYAHLGSVAVRRGEQVRRGESIGLLGATGTTTGPHLHYEVRRFDVPLDPCTLFYPTLDSSLAAFQALTAVE